MNQQLDLFAQPVILATNAPRPAGSLIYEPNGRAREYAALACNVYAGCSHACVYCYAVDATRKTKVEFAAAKLRPATFIPSLVKEAVKYQAAGVRDQVLLSFTCDPYQPLDIEYRVTRRAIQILHAHDLTVCTLTKGGSRALRDLDLFGLNDAFASTLTFLDDARSIKWEPGAALPADRIAAIVAFHKAGIPTWVSLEPTIDPAASLDIIRRTHEHVDLFKVGRLNYHPAASNVDWRHYAQQAVTLLQSLGYHRETNHDAVQSANSANRLFYVKHDLASYLSSTAR